jgi:hypothetical protein
MLAERLQRRGALGQVSLSPASPRGVAEVDPGRPSERAGREEAAHGDQARSEGVDVLGHPRVARSGREHEPLERVEVAHSRKISDEELVPAKLLAVATPVASQALGDCVCVAVSERRRGVLDQPLRRLKGPAAADAPSGSEVRAASLAGASPGRGATGRS